MVRNRPRPGTLTNPRNERLAHGDACNDARPRTCTSSAFGTSQGGGPRTWPCHAKPIACSLSPRTSRDAICSTIWSPRPIQAQVPLAEPAVLGACTPDAAATALKLLNIVPELIELGRVDALLAKDGERLKKLALDQSCMPLIKALCARSRCSRPR